MKCKICCCCYKCRVRKPLSITRKINLQEENKEVAKSDYIFDNKIVISVLDQVKQIESTYLVLSLLMFAGAFYGHLFYSKTNPIENFDYIRLTGSTIVGFLVVIMAHDLINKLKNTLVIYFIFLLLFVGIPFALGLNGFYVACKEKVSISA